MDFITALLPRRRKTFWYNILENCVYTQKIKMKMKGVVMDIDINKLKILFTEKQIQNRIKELFF